MQLHNSRGNTTVSAQETLALTGKGGSGSSNKLKPSPKLSKGPTVQQELLLPIALQNLVLRLAASSSPLGRAHDLELHQIRRQPAHDITMREL